MENNQQKPEGTKGATAENESKPVGYGSSIQSDGHGNRTRPQNQEDVNPTTQQDHIQQVKEEKTEETLPETNGTGANPEVATAHSVVIKKEEKG